MLKWNPLFAKRRRKKLAITAKSSAARRNKPVTLPTIKGNPEMITIDDVMSKVTAALKEIALGGEAYQAGIAREALFHLASLSDNEEERDHTMKQKTHRFVVEVRTTLSWSDTAEFINDAVSSWGGQYFPGDDEQNADPHFEIKSDDVKVKRFVRPKAVKDERP